MCVSLDSYIFKSCLNCRAHFIIGGMCVDRCVWCVRREDGLTERERESERERETGRQTDRQAGIQADDVLCFLSGNGPFLTVAQARVWLLG